MEIYNIEKLRGLNPCYDPLDALPPEWEGTLFDIFFYEKHVPLIDRIWTAVRHETLSQKQMEELCLLICNELNLNSFYTEIAQEGSKRLTVEKSKELRGRLNLEEVLGRVLFEMCYLDVRNSFHGLCKQILDEGILEESLIEQLIGEFVQNKENYE